MVAGILGASAHFFFYFVFKYGFHLPYENFWLRLIATLMCISVMFMHKLPDSFRPYFPYLWHFFLIFVLPFIFTVNLIMNNFHELWLYWEIFMIFTLMMFVPNWLIFLFDFLVGIAAAILFSVLFYPDFQLHPDFNIPLYSIVVGFSLFAGYIFSFSNWKSLKDLEQKKAEEKYRALEALAGSIAHEMRNPLTQIQHNIEEIQIQFNHSLSESDSALLPESFFATVNKRIKNAQMAVNRGLHVITMTLGNFRNTDLSQNNLSCISASTITRKAVEEYGYASEAEKMMIVFEPEEDFIFLGEEDNYILVLYNLLVNALQFLHSVPEGRIVISLKKGQTVNTIFVRDNGPGISPEILPRIFEPFFTVGKKGGTGLGLAFCKRVMQSFNGDITCKSEKGKYTEFALEFPVVAPEVIQDYESSLYAEYTPFFAGKKILLACNQPDRLATMRMMLAPLKVELHEAGNENDAFEKLLAKNYDLFLADSDQANPGTPDMAEKLKAMGIAVPAVTCLNSPQSMLGHNSQTSNNVLFMPLALHDLLNTLKIAIITNHSIRKESSDTKTVLVVDDLDFNRKVIKSMLNKLGVRILEGSNGLEALKILEKERCDLLIMDMRMPVLDGFETAKQIRAGNSHFRNIPILGLSGNLDNSTMKITQECGINESLMKPVKLKPFLQKVTAMLKISQPSD
ncbi:MAG: hybrid sensor histidine kinase/response regulator [Chlorobiaceae bacterium]|nr:hybrid sensor histidine kinase/response regulator [Chlorobiaceae bacterium]